MTLAQLAIATRSSSIWLSNSSRLLRRRLHRTPSGARWWALVRMLSVETGLPLATSAKVADATLGQAQAIHRVRLPTSIDQALSLTIDLERFHSTANAALAAALVFAPPKRRGRPRRSVSRARPTVDHLSEVWTIRVEDSDAALERLAGHLREWSAYPRGIEAGLPFIMDAATLRAVPRLALTSAKGHIDVVVQPHGMPTRTPALTR